MQKRVSKAGALIGVLLAVVLLVAAGLRMFQYSPSPQEENARPSATAHGSSKVAEGALEPQETAVTAQATVSGFVLYAATHAPVQAATVKVDNSEEPSREAVTDKDGRFTISNLLPDTEVVLTVEAGADLVLAEKKKIVKVGHGQALTGIELLLHGTGSISGQVIGTKTIYDPANILNLKPLTSWESAVTKKEESPVSGVSLLLFGNKHPAVPANLTMVTDGAGSYRFSGLPAGAYGVRVYPPEEAVLQSEYKREKIVNLQPGEMAEKADFSFCLDAAIVEGRVLDRNGTPVPAAEILAEHTPQWYGESNREVAPTINTVSDDDGCYILSGLLPRSIANAYNLLTIDQELPREGTYIVYARAPGFAVGHITVPIVTPDLAGATRQLRSLTGEKPAAPQLQPISLPTGSGRTIRNMDIILGEAASLGGCVVTDKGVAVPNAQIAIVPADLKIGQAPSGWESSQRSLATDPSGSFLFPNIAGGTDYKFEVRFPDGISIDPKNAPISLAEGQNVENVQVVIPEPVYAAPGSISGAVYSAANGKPIETFDVKVVEVLAPEGIRANYGKITLNTPQNNSFSVDGVGPGTVKLLCTAKGYAPRELVLDVPQQPANATDVRLEAGGIIRGNVTSHVKATVTAYEGSKVVLEVPVGEDGTYQISDLAEGSYFVVARAIRREERMARSEKAVATVTTGEVAQVDFNLEGNATIVGSCTCGPDARCDILVWNIDASLDAVDASQQPPPDEQATGSAWRKNGPYEIRNLPPGTYEVLARCSIYEGDKATDSTEQKRQVVVNKEQTVEVNFDF